MFALFNRLTFWFQVSNLCMFILPENKIRRVRSTRPYNLHILLSMQYIHWDGTLQFTYITVNAIYTLRRDLTIYSNAIYIHWDGTLQFTSTLYIHHVLEYLREHPFNLKGGGGLWFFSESTFFSPLRSAPEFFSRDNLTLFFSTKTIFVEAQNANRIFFSAHFRDWIFFSTKFADRIFFPQKKHSPPTPSS